MDRSAARWTIGLIVSGLMAGCSSPLGTDGAGSADERPQRQESLWTATKNKILLLDGREGDVVRVYRNAAWGEADCPAPWSRTFFWINVWNRTGLALYQDYQVQKPITGFDYTARLPPDPPYVLWAGTECWFQVDLEFRSNEYVVTSNDIANRPDTPNPQPTRLTVVTEFDRTVDIQVPLGQTRGEGILSLEGPDHLLNYGLGLGDFDRTGSRYGTVTVYEPNGRILWDSKYEPFSSEWRTDHQRTGMGGNYRVVLELAQPALQPTTWVGRANVDSFVPQIAGYGFQVPFVVYDNDPVP